LKNFNPKLDDASPTDTIIVTIETSGYHSRIELPVTATDKASEFCEWFKMQLDYLARWTPGSTATIRETKHV
jgi:hypothetical protein